MIVRARALIGCEMQHECRCESKDFVYPLRNYTTLGQKNNNILIKLATRDAAKLTNRLDLSKPEADEVLMGLNP